MYLNWSGTRRGRSVDQNPLHRRPFFILFYALHLSIRCMDAWKCSTLEITEIESSPFNYSPTYIFIQSLTCNCSSRGRYGSGGKSCCLAVGGLPVQSHPGRVEMSLSKTPNPKLLLMSWLVPCMAANRHWCGNGWKRGINCKALWIKAL